MPEMSNSSKKTAYCVWQFSVAAAAYAEATEALEATEAAEAIEAMEASDAAEADETEAKAKDAITDEIGPKSIDDNVWIGAPLSGMDTALVVLMLVVVMLDGADVEVTPAFVDVLDVSGREQVSSETSRLLGYGPDQSKDRLNCH